MLAFCLCFRVHGFRGTTTATTATVYYYCCYCRYYCYHNCHCRLLFAFLQRRRPRRRPRQLSCTACAPNIDSIRAFVEIELQLGRTPRAIGFDLWSTQRKAPQIFEAGAHAKAHSRFMMLSWGEAIKSKTNMVSGNRVRCARQSFYCNSQVQFATFRCRLGLGISMITWYFGAWKVSRICNR